MGIVFRQSVKNLVVVALGALLGGLIIWLSTSYLTKQQYGFTRNFTNYAITIAQILLLGFNSTLSVYIHRYTNDPARKKALISCCLLLPFVFACIFSAAYYPLRPRILDHFQPVDRPFMESYFAWLPLYILLFIYMIILEQYLGSQMKVAVSAFMREVVVRIVQIALVVLFGFGYISFQVVTIGSVLVYLIPVVAFFLLSARTPFFGFSLNLRSFEKEEYKEMVHFTWYHFLLTVSILLIGYMDAISLSFYDKNGFSAVAVYGVAVFLISFLQLPQKALVPASFTVLAKAFADNNLAHARDLFVRSSLNILIPSIAIAVLICCNLQNAVLVIKDGYSEIIPVFLILFIGRLADFGTGMNDQVLSITNYYKFNFYLSLLLMITLLVSLRLLVPLYGIYGAAWSTTLTIVIFNTIKFLFVWNKVGLQPFSINTLKVVFAGGAAFLAGYFFPHFFDQAHHIYVRTAADVVLRSTAAIAVYAAMLIWLKPSADLQEYMASIRKNKRLF